MTQVFLRLALLMDPRFFGAVSCDLLRAESESEFESLFEWPSKANTYGIAGCRWRVSGRHLPGTDGMHDEMISKALR